MSRTKIAINIPEDVLSAVDAAAKERGESWLPPSHPTCCSLRCQATCVSKKGEANLPRPSVVNVTLVRTTDRDRLGESIGVLSSLRNRQVLQGLALVFGLDEQIDQAPES